MSKRKLSAKEQWWRWYKRNEWEIGVVVLMLIGIAAFSFLYWVNNLLPQ